jgi:hypothetical protein
MAWIAFVVFMCGLFCLGIAIAIAVAGRIGE